MRGPHAQCRTAQARVVFGEAEGVPWLNLLRPVFRHCFVLMPAAGGWILYNPMSHATELRWLTFDQAAALVARSGAAVDVAVDPEPAATPLPWRPFTCVEAVKRVLGLRAPGVFTPWQLFRRLVPGRK